MEMEVALEIDGRKLATDQEGYLVEPAEWNEHVARALAANENIELSDEHWAVIHFMRGYYQQHQVAADVRFVIRHLKDDLGKDDARSLVFRLFPYGYVKQACKIAGMKRPRAWSTG